MRLVDSSGWLEFFTDGPLAGRYELILSNLSEIVAPAIVLYEVYKKIRSERSEEHALITTAQIQKTRMVPLTETLAMTAADLSLQYRLAMADAIVYATAIVNGADMVTSDSDFARLPHVTFLKKPQRRKRAGAPALDCQKARYSARKELAGSIRRMRWEAVQTAVAAADSVAEASRQVLTSSG